MINYIAPAKLTGAILMSTLLLAGGCKSRDQLTEDSALAREVELAKRDAQPPTLTDVPKTVPPPATTTPTRPPTRPPTTTTTTPPRATTGTVSSGTSISMTSAARICTNTNKASDSFSAMLTESVTGTNGSRIPAGATATFTVTSVKRGTNVNDHPVLVIAAQSVMVDGRTYPIEADVTSAEVISSRSETKKADATKVVGGAIIGAIAGQILGKNTKSTVIGAAGGAAAGTAVAIVTGDSDGCIPEGGKITAMLTSPLVIPAS